MKQTIRLRNMGIPHYVMNVFFHCGSVRTLCYTDYDYMVERAKVYMNRELVKFVTASYFDGESSAEIFLPDPT